MEEGLTQTAKKSRDDRQLFVLNFPIDIGFKSSNPFGCKLCHSLLDLTATITDLQILNKNQFVSHKMLVTDMYLCGCGGPAPKFVFYPQACAIPTRDSHCINRSPHIL